MSNLKKTYQMLSNTNGDLVAEYTKRSSNYQELLAALKKVNQILQNAGKLRCGNARTRTVQACRSAIKSNNVFCSCHAKNLISQVT